MNLLIQELKKDLHATLGLQISVEKWPQNDVFPLFLQGLYDFYQTQIFNKLYLIAAAKSHERPTAICKHILLAQEIAGIPCIYVGFPAHTGKQTTFVKHQILFVIPKKQIHLPEIGINWAENRKHPLLYVNKPLSPVAHLVAIYALFHPEQHALSLRKMATTLFYTPMSISRAFDELEGQAFGHTIRQNKERIFQFTHHSSPLWKSLSPFLKSPIKKRIWIQWKEKPLGFLAGRSALAQLTSLAEPEHPVYAMGHKQYACLSFISCESPDDADIELEIWHYDPAIFAVSGRVDPLSLYLSLRNLQDERVEEALETMIKGNL